MARVALVAAGAAAAVVIAVSAPFAATTDSVVLRAGRHFQQVGPFNVRRDPTLRGAVSAFGFPTSCRIVDGITSVATWANLGVRIRLTTLGGVPAGETPCTYGEIRVASILVTGRRWRTSLGLRRGDSVSRLRRLYPTARYQRAPHGSSPGRSYWLVHVRERCYIGICPTPFVSVPRLTAQINRGRVGSFFFPVGAQGE